MAKSNIWETPPELWRGWKSAEPFRSGQVVSLHVARAAGDGMIAVPEVRAVPDRGLEGDRFFRASWAALGRPDKAITLIEIETIEAAEGELDVKLSPGDIRRNVVTRGVPLIELLGREFSVGEVVLRGLRLFEPCMHMERLVGVPGVCRALLHRSGLKAAIVTEGTIRVGDAVALGESKASAAVSL
ncbi:MAG TPA: MOSC domain-containing protein [Candidatus Acidoferrales bacterium]|nr:MOSC domain-containing protein [Candidatus Acidoferrales bacterium]